MWSRTDIKLYAKGFLRQHFWKAFLVVLVTTLLMGGAASNSTSSSNNQLNQQFEFTEDFNLPGNVDNPSFIFKQASKVIKSPLFFFGIVPSIILAILLSILYVAIGYGVEVGQSKFFLDGFKGDVDMMKVFSVFNKKDYIPVVKTQFLKFLYIFLWTLLLIVPGIIKAYEYQFVSYILAEEPTLPSSEVLARSKEITYGNKLDMFVLDLSFIGWYILGAFAFGVGIFFVNPYKEATYARLYNVLTKNEDLEYEYMNDMIIDV